MLSRLLPPRLLLLLTLLLLHSCILYVPDVEQGNIVSEQMVSQIKVGQSEQQVRFILGTPLIKDQFHKERWDYFYSIKKGRSEKIETKQLTIFFKQGRVEKIIHGD